MQRSLVFKFSKLYTEDSEVSNFYVGPDSGNQIETVFDLKPDFDYYDLHDFHKLINKTSASKNKTAFSVFHTNICSLMYNFGQLEMLLVDLDFKFDVIALTETWNSKKKGVTFDPGFLDGY